MLPIRSSNLKIKLNKGKLFAKNDMQIGYGGQKSVVITSGHFKFTENVYSLEFDLNAITNSYKLQSIQSINVDWGAFSGGDTDLGILSARIIDNNNMKIIVQTSKNPQPSTEQNFYITINAQLL